MKNVYFCSISVFEDSAEHQIYESLVNLTRGRWQILDSRLSQNH